MFHAPSSTRPPQGRSLARCIHYSCSSLPHLTSRVPFINLHHLLYHPIIISLFARTYSLLGHDQLHPVHYWHTEDGWCAQVARSFFCDVLSSGSSSTKSNHGIHYSFHKPIKNPSLSSIALPITLHIHPPTQKVCRVLGPTHIAIPIK
jgi:hypothetical protein